MQRSPHVINMIKKCVVCGTEFRCPPSAKKVTCSKECSRIRKKETHEGKKNLWSEESKRRIAERGKTENLKLGTKAAKKSQKSDVLKRM